MIQTYSPQLVVVIFKAHVITGFAEGTFVSIERAEDAYSEAVGSQGTTARVHNANDNGAVTVTLQQSSPSNDILAAIAKLDDPRRGINLGVGDLAVKELNGTLLARSSNAYIRKLPKIDRAKEFMGVEWVIACSPLKVDFVGSLPVI